MDRPEKPGETVTVGMVFFSSSTRRTVQRVFQTRRPVAQSAQQNDLRTQGGQQYGQTLTKPQFQRKLQLAAHRPLLQKRAEQRGRAASFRQGKIARRRQPVEKRVFDVGAPERFHRPGG